MKLVSTVDAPHDRVRRESAHHHQKDGAKDGRDTKFLSRGRDLETACGDEDVQEDTGVAENDDGARNDRQYSRHEHDSVALVGQQDAAEELRHVADPVQSTSDARQNAEERDSTRCHEHEHGVRALGNRSCLHVGVHTL